MSVHLLSLPINFSKDSPHDLTSAPVMFLQWERGRRDEIINYAPSTLAGAHPSIPRPHLVCLALMHLMAHLHRCGASAGANAKKTAESSIKGGRFTLLVRPLSLSDLKDLTVIYKRYHSHNGFVLFASLGINKHYAWRGVIEWLHYNMIVMSGKWLQVTKKDFFHCHTMNHRYSSLELDCYMACSMV